MPPKIFINYRKEDSPWNSLALYQELIKHFPKENVFKDFNNIKPGNDFIETIENALETCDVLLVLISEKWLTIEDKKGNRRINNPDDFVRLEIGTALKRNICVIPVLFDNAVLPQADELPDDLKKLSRRQFIEIDKTRFESDMTILIEAIKGQVVGTELNPPNPPVVKEIPVPVESGIKHKEEIPLVKPGYIVKEEPIPLAIWQKKLSPFKYVFIAGAIIAVFFWARSYVQSKKPLIQISLLSFPYTSSIADDSLKYYKDYGELSGVKDQADKEFDYYGGVLNGKPEGYGVAIYKTGIKYIGYFENGLRNGKGKITWKSGDSYSGEFKDDFRHGFGTYEFADGRKYVGYFLEGQMNGQGTYTWPTGIKYIGNFVDGKRNGKGEVYVTDSIGISNCPGAVTYKGEYKNDLKDGQGKCYDKNGNLLYDGLFKEGKPLNKYPSTESHNPAG